MKRLKILFSLLLTSFFALQGMAQHTGSFDTTIVFMGQSRSLSCYVPTNYNANTSYKLMVGLHGQGDNSANYRNALINTLSWEKNFPNTIFIFPDGGTDTYRDFYTPTGDEAVVDSAIAFAMQSYSIDPNYIVLQGFSLGGRSAAKFGLDNPNRFKGLLLNTPAFQGKRDVDGDPKVSLIFNYANAAQIPVYITVGEDDFYFAIINPVIKKLKRYDAKVKYITIAGMGHNVPDSIFTTPSFPFFENPVGRDFDVDIFDIELPLHTCDNTITPSCFVQNMGGVDITSLDLEYQFAGGNGTYTWTGNIAPFEHKRITLPAMNTSNGKQTLALSVGAVNVAQLDTVTSNNTISDTVEVDLQSVSLPLLEGFESNTLDWVINTRNSLFYWYTDTDVKKSGTTSIENFNTVLLFNTRGNVESFESPVMDLTALTDPKLRYDIAYNYHKYTPPYFAVDTIFADALEVTVSVDCGQTWQSIYKKAGAELATTANPILNPLNLNQAMFTPKANEWRTDTLDLSAFSTSTEAIIRFNYISDIGGSINLDNIAVTGMPISLVEEPISSLEMFPNPAKEGISISTGLEDFSTVTIYNLSGQKVFGKTYEKQTRNVYINTSAFPVGMYQVEVTGKNKRWSEKLIIAN